MILQNLNEEQKQSVVTTEGTIRLIAGAGTGKTKALTHRYAYLVNELGISPSNILCVTFTNKAANEMKQRIRTMLGDLDTGHICTFHGFCVKILREDIHAINYPKSFIVMDAEDTETILKKVYESAHITSKDCTFAKAREYISSEKTSESSHIPYLVDLDTTKLLNEFNEEQDIQKKIYLGYLYEQKKCYGLDFDDLLTLTMYIFNFYAEKKEKWQKRMMYVMVDEFQDVSNSQYELVAILSEYHQNLFVVGDPDQTIYSWRGANIEYILDFDKCFKDSTTIVLDKNYRSSKQVLDVSNSLITKNKNRIEKELQPASVRHGRAVYFHGRTSKSEAEWIAKNIKTLCTQGVEFSEIAILYRSHFVSRSMEEIFIKEKIPYVLYSGVEFYKRKEIKDVLSYLRMVLYGDDLSFLRVVNEPKRNIGKKRIAILQEYADYNNCTLYNALKANMDNDLIRNSNAKQFVDTIEKYAQLYKEMSISNLLAGILAESGYEVMLRQAGEQERLDNLSELKQSIC